LADHLKEFTGAKVCYIGKKLKPFRKGVPDTGDEDWHIQAKADDEIQFTHVSHSDEDTIDKDSKEVVKTYQHIVG
jgi:hypothetical protein